MDSPSKSKTITARSDVVQLPAVIDNNIPIAPQLCPGAQPPDDPVDPIAAEIRREYRLTLQSILRVAKACAAGAQLNPLKTSQLFKNRRLPFDRTVFSKYAAIGRNKLCSPNVFRSIFRLAGRSSTCSEISRRKNSIGLSPRGRLQGHHHATKSVNGSQRTAAIGRKTGGDP